MLLVFSCSFCLKKYKKYISALWSSLGDDHLQAASWTVWPSDIPTNPYTNTFIIICDWENLWMIHETKSKLRCWWLRMNTSSRMSQLLALPQLPLGISCGQETGMPNFIWQKGSLH